MSEAVAILWRLGEEAHQAGLSKEQYRFTVTHDVLAYLEANGLDDEQIARADRWLSETLPTIERHFWRSSCLPFNRRCGGALLLGIQTANVLLAFRSILHA
jgi:hypothetical protein